MKTIYPAPLRHAAYVVAWQRDFLPHIEAALARQCEPIMTPLPANGLTTQGLADDTSTRKSIVLSITSPLAISGTF